MKSLLLKKIHAMDGFMDTITDIFIEDGLIAKLGTNLNIVADVTIDGSNLCAIPSLFDMHVHLRDPGQEYKEDIATGTKSALAGGITGLACMPNTCPPIDNVETVNYILDKSKGTGVNVYPVGCITKSMSGGELADYDDLINCGVKMISDDGRPVKNAEILRQALEQSEKNGLLIASHCEDMDIIGKGIMHRGDISNELNVQGMDRASEDSITAREISLAMSTNARIHICHVSTKGSLDFIRNAKKSGVKVTCETCPHYFKYTHEKLLARDADYRMNPPLREESDRLAVIEALKDGTIDCIVTDHAPHSKEDKTDFLNAPNGVVGMETSLAVVLNDLYHNGIFTLKDIIEKMSYAPRRIMGISTTCFKVGQRADITVVDLQKEWVVEPEKLHSKSKNTVFKGEKLKGKVMYTISEGVIRYNYFDERI